MDLPISPAEEPTPGAWNRRRRVTLGLTALALVAGGGVAIAAGSANGTDSAPTVRPANPVPGKAGFAGAVLHSESVVSDGNGGYVTRLSQVGTIESIDAGNLTVVSDDGYKRAWTRNADTVAGGANWSVTKNDDGSFTVRKTAAQELATGQQVLVLGTLANDVATAERIMAQPAGGGEIPGSILKGLAGGEDPGALKDRLMQRGGNLKGTGPMGGPSGQMPKFQFRNRPNGEGGTVVAPAPGEAFGPGGAIPAPDAPAPAPDAPAAGTAPAEPSAAYSASSFSVT
jgi:hypothetical protein